MKKILIPASIVIAVFVLALVYLVYSGDDTVGGTDAWRIVASRWTYWLGVGIALAISFVVILMAYNREVAGLGINFIAFLLAAIIALALIMPAANVKADPIGSGATTEQIEHLRANGYLK